MSKKGTFVLGSGREPLNITESQIRYAMENSRSNNEAARFLNISSETYKKYASMYVDATTGKTLYELHKNQSGKGISRPNSGKNKGNKLDDILAGKHPDYQTGNLRRRLLKENIIPIRCHNCGFDEFRIDGKIPLLLYYENDDLTDHRMENLKWLCYNCHFLLVGNIVGRKPKYWY